MGKTLTNVRLQLTTIIIIKLIDSLTLNNCNYDYSVLKWSCNYLSLRDMIYFANVVSVVITPSVKITTHFSQLIP